MWTDVGSKFDFKNSAPTRFLIRGEMTSTISAEGKTHTEVPVLSQKEMEENTYKTINYSH